jgi:hypothetical protein
VEDEEEEVVLVMKSQFTRSTRFRGACVTEHARRHVSSRANTDPTACIHTAPTSCIHTNRAGASPSPSPLPRNQTFSAPPLSSKSGASRD